ncbi:MAG: hypothetical protein GY705_27790 [Bacteroidetes bacterium]|nr:hypothetical protein [Bacteroidota bacterium]
MKNAFLILILLFIGIFSCTKDEMHVDDTGFKNMDFDNLEIGDVFRYILLNGESIWDENNSNFNYTGDTLEVEVVDIQNGKYVVSESITAHSSYWLKDSVCTNFWVIRNDSLIIESNDNNQFLQSHLFFNFFCINSLPLIEFTENEVTITGWKTSKLFSANDDDLFTENFTLLGNTYERSNVFICTWPMAFDGPGSTYVYNRENGIIRTSTYSAWTGEGHGWDRIE